MEYLNVETGSVLLFCLSMFAPNLTSSLRSRRGTSHSLDSDPQLPYTAQQATPESGCVPDQVDFVYSTTLTDESSLERARVFTQLQNQRRSLRFYDTRPFPVELLQQCIETGGTAPSGAHQQPWHFCIVQDPGKKAAIREEVERAEQLNYDKRMKQSWKDDLEPIFKNSALHQDGVIQKPYLTEAPYLVVVTELLYGLHPETGGGNIVTDQYFCCAVRHFL